MDPLSVSAALIGTIAAIKAIYDPLQQLITKTTRAPAEVYQLNDELNDLCLVLTALQDSAFSNDADSQLEGQSRLTSPPFLFYQLILAPRFVIRA